MAQKRLAKLISKVSSKKQIVLCTHSPYFVDWQDFLNGASFVRLNKHNDKECTVGCLQKDRGEYVKYIQNNINDWMRQQRLDLVAKEIFFSDSVLFVEGQEDVGLIRKWLADNKIEVNFDIFGYGAGGHGDIPAFIEMAKDLGLIKVAALFDGDEGAKESYDKVFIYHEFRIEALPTDDIRDKPDKYDLALMSDLSESEIPGRGKLYIELNDGSLRYKVLGTNNKVIEVVIKLESKDLNGFAIPEKLTINDKLQKSVRSIIFNRGHIQGKKGCFYENGNPKPEYKIKFKKIMDGFLDYFNNTSDAKK